jgi:hypothetical protein
MKKLVRPYLIHIATSIELIESATAGKTLAD